MQNPVPKLYKSIIDDVVSNSKDIFLDDGLDEHILLDLKQLWLNKLNASKAVDFMNTESEHVISTQLAIQQHFAQQQANIAAAMAMQNNTLYQQAYLNQTLGFNKDSTSSSAAAAFAAIPPHLYQHFQSVITNHPNFKQTQKTLKPLVLPPATNQSMMMGSTTSKIHSFLTMNNNMNNTTATEISHNVLSLQQNNNASLQLSNKVKSGDNNDLTEPIIQIDGHFDKGNKEGKNNRQIFQLDGKYDDEEDDNVNNPTSDFRRHHHNKYGDNESMEPTKMQKNKKTKTQINNKKDTTNNFDLEQNANTVKGGGGSVIVHNPQSKSNKMQTKVTTLSDNSKQDNEKKGKKRKNVNHTKYNDQVQEGDIDDELESSTFDDTNPVNSMGLSSVSNTDTPGFFEPVDDEYDDDDDLIDKGLDEADFEDYENDLKNESSSPTNLEEPLNSGDDVSEDQDAADLFDTDNIVVCQYEKITRSRNKWKFYFKDGIMNLNGKDYVFQRALGEAEW